jgi:hypothetical protein
MKIYINNARENYSLHLTRRQAQDVTELEKVCTDEECPKSYSLGATASFFECFVLLNM